MHLSIPKEFTIVLGDRDGKGKEEKRKKIKRKEKKPTVFLRQKE